VEAALSFDRIFFFQNKNTCLSFQNYYSIIKQQRMGDNVTNQSPVGRSRLESHLPDRMLEFRNAFGRYVHGEFHEDVQRYLEGVWKRKARDYATTLPGNTPGRSVTVDRPTPRGPRQAASLPEPDAFQFFNVNTPHMQTAIEQQKTIVQNLQADAQTRRADAFARFQQEIAELTNEDIRVNHAVMALGHWIPPTVNPTMDVDDSDVTGE
jgi:hypothetical protein